ncbi:hypothetical protein BHE74_00046591 [Ensete ventricosum]|nr:hypothetical protein BHE74_00046591 [Ensete ventricosum]
MARHLRVSWVSSLAKSIGPALGRMLPGHVDRLGRGLIIIPIILGEGSFRFVVFMRCDPVIGRSRSTRLLCNHLVVREGPPVKVKSSLEGMVGEKWKLSGEAESSLVKRQPVPRLGINPSGFFIASHYSLCGYVADCLLRLWYQLRYCLSLSIPTTPHPPSPPFCSPDDSSSKLDVLRLLSHSKSCSVTISTHRSRVLDHPSGDSRSTVIHSSSEGAAPADSEAAEALAAMRSCFNVHSTVTTCQLVNVRKHYYIPSEYKLHVPLSRERPYDAFPSGFSLSTDALEAGLRFPLHPVIEACLEGWQISPS